MKMLALTTSVASLLLFTSDIVGAQTARARIAAVPIRSEPNLASAIIATLNEGAPVDVVDLQGDWYRVLVPNDQGKPRVGYVLARLLDILNADGSLQSIQESPTSRGARPNANGPSNPPTVVPVRPQRAKVPDREQEASRAEVDRLKAELMALEDAPAMSQSRVRQLPQVVARQPQVREGFWPARYLRAAEHPDQLRGPRPARRADPVSCIRLFDSAVTIPTCFSRRR